MFDKQYRFMGKHAQYVDALTGLFLDTEYSRAKIFERNIDVYINASLIGFLYGRKADLDRTKNHVTDQIDTQSVMGDRVIGSEDDLLFNFRLIMLLDKEYEPDEDKRINNAFRCYDNPDNEKLFDSYVRGGVEVLYEKLINKGSSPIEYVERLFEFIQEFHDRFNSLISNHDIKAILMNK